MSDSCRLQSEKTTSEPIGACCSSSSVADRCCCGGPSVPEFLSADTQADTIVVRAFQISGLDCIEEVRILERAVGPLVGGKDQLAFDVLNGHMRIHESAEVISDRSIKNAVAATGMRATRVGEPGAETVVPGAADRWRIRLTILSGSALLLGILLYLTSIIELQSGSGLVNAIAMSALPVAPIVAWLLATVAGVWFVLPKAWYSLKSMQPDMNLLMMIAVVGALLIGEYFESATVAFLFALSLLLESWSVGRARNAVTALLELAPPTVRIVNDQEEERVVLPADVSVGTTFIVRAGDRIALDGKVVKGLGSVDQAPITGESAPVPKEPGDEVFAGTINGEGTLIVQATRGAQDTVLARITRSIGDAHAKRAQSERWVDSFARRYTPTVMALALLVLLIPPLAFGAAWQTWFYNALVLLVIACPCALVISTPVSIVAALASAARHGVLIKGGTYVELPARLNALALDKTGTLTMGKPTVQKIVPLDGRHEHILLAEAAALESRSTHPLATAIVQAAAESGINVQPAEDVSVMAGQGLWGQIGGRRLWMGSVRFAREMLYGAGDGPFDEVAEHQIASLEQAGNTVVVIGSDNGIIGVLGLADTIRPEARSVIDSLHAMGVSEIVMLTGDNAVTARTVAEAVGIDTVRAELMPEDKVAEVEALARRHTVVAMIGDGVNDAPAMARASFGVAMGAIGSDAAIETADIALMSDELKRLPWLIHHAEHTLRIIRQNIVFSLLVKAFFVGLTLFGLASLWGAIAADVGATLLVTGNALRLLRAEPEDPPAHCCPV